MAARTTTIQKYLKQLLGLTEGLGSETMQSLDNHKPSYSTLQKAISEAGGVIYEAVLSQSSTDVPVVDTAAGLHDPFDINTEGVYGRADVGDYTFDAVLPNPLKSLILNVNNVRIKVFNNSQSVTPVYIAYYLTYTINTGTITAGIKCFKHDGTPQDIGGQFIVVIEVKL